MQDISLFAVTGSQCTEDEHDDENEDDFKFRDLGLVPTAEPHHGNFRFPVPDQLSTEKPSSNFISADSKNDFLGARIVSFVIPKGGLDGKRIKPGFSSLFFPKT